MVQECKHKIVQFLHFSDKKRQAYTFTRGQKVHWLTTEIKKLMKERDNLHKLALKTNSELHWSSFKRMRNAVTLKLRREKKHYYNNQF